MAKIFITQSYKYPLDKKQWKNMQPYPPLGTLYACSILKSHNHEVEFFDNGLTDDLTEIKLEIQKSPSEIFLVYEDGFNYLTKMCLTDMRHIAFELLQYARGLGKKTIVSSSDASDHAELYLQNGADFVIDGEADKSVVELVRGLEMAQDLSEIQGIIYIGNGVVQKNAKRPILRDLDSIPMPAWDMIDLAPYKEIWLKKHGYFSLNLSTTRGCPFKCNWCAKPIYGNRYNSRTVHNVIEEIEFLIETYDVHHFWVCDDIFGLKKSWVHEFANEVESKQLNFQYKIQSRADLLLQEENIRDLAKSGCKEVWIGAESGSQKILDAMDKGTTVEQISEATELLKQEGIKPCFFIQLGYLGETEQDLKSTVDMIEHLNPADIGISVSYPLPGTKFYERVQNDLENKANWTDSDDLDMMFEGTYKSHVYRDLHRYIHKKFRLKKSKELMMNRRLNNLSFKKLALEAAKISYYSIYKDYYKFKLKQCKIHL